MQKERRRDPYAWTWEFPAGIAAVTVLVVVTGIQVGRSLANLLAGAGWTWPTASGGASMGTPFGAAFWGSIPGILRGDSAAGLGASPPSSVAGPVLLWISIILTEAVLLASATLAGVRVFHRWGPGQMRGMASRDEAEKLLGLTRLRKVAPLVRPDLYGTQPPGPEGGIAGLLQPAGTAPDPGPGR